MNKLMTLPVSMVEQLQADEMILINGGYDIISAANNGSGNCGDQTNNADGLCGGTNNDQGRCSGTNNAGGRCGALLSV